MNRAKVDPGGGDQQRLLLALGLIAVFMVGEVVVGAIASSLALLADAGHMLSDAGGLGLALAALRLAARPPAGGFTYGLKRAEILSGLVNGVTLFVVGGLVVIEAIQRLIAPPTVGAKLVLAVALAGIVLNLLATQALRGATRRSLNIEGSLRHVMTDLFAFIGTALAAIVILTAGFERADPIASLLTATLMVGAAYGLIHDAGRVLLEAAPMGVDPERVGEAIAAHPHVANVHDLHVWEITSGFPALSAHVLVHPGDDCHAIRLELESLVKTTFGIEHTTLQVDHAKPGQVLKVTPLDAR